MISEHGPGYWMVCTTRVSTRSSPVFSQHLLPRGLERKQRTWRGATPAISPPLPLGSLVVQKAAHELFVPLGYAFEACAQATLPSRAHACASPCRVLPSILFSFQCTHTCLYLDSLAVLKYMVPLKCVCSYQMYPTCQLFPKG